MTLDVWIPGEPCSQGRARARIVRGKGGKPILKNGQPFISVYDPAKSRSWKGAAQFHMQQALPAGWKPLEGPVEVAILAVFTCPTTDHRKRQPRDRRYHAKAGDPDNIGKAVLDSAQGVLFLNDCQVARLEVEKHIGAQGEAPYVLVRVSPLPEEVPPDAEEEQQEVEVEAGRSAPQEAGAQGGSGR